MDSETEEGKTIDDFERKENIKKQVAEKFKIREEDRKLKDTPDVNKAVSTSNPRKYMITSKDKNAFRLSTKFLSKKYVARIPDTKSRAKIKGAENLVSAGYRVTPFLDALLYKSPIVKNIKPLSQKGRTAKNTLKERQLIANVLGEGMNIAYMAARAIMGEGARLAIDDVAASLLANIGPGPLHDKIITILKSPPLFAQFLRASEDLGSAPKAIAAVIAKIYSPVTHASDYVRDGLILSDNLFVENLIYFKSKTVQHKDTLSEMYLHMGVNAKDIRIKE